MKEHKEINLVEAALVIMVVALVDLFEFLITFVPIAGEVIKFFTNSVTWLLIQIWLKFKGARGIYFALGAVAEYIPIFNALPAKTILLIATVVIHNKFPEVEEIAGQVKKTASKRVKAQIKNVG